MKASCCSTGKSHALAAGSIVPLALGVLLPKCPMCIPFYLAALGAVGASHELGAELLSWARIPLLGLGVVLLGLGLASGALRSRGRRSRPAESPAERGGPGRT